MRYMLQANEGRDGGGGGGLGTYILTSRTDMIPVDTLTWGQWMETEREKPVGESLWRVGHNDLVGGLMVSTVFLGIDHGFRRGGAPIVFETMAFFPVSRAFKDKFIKGFDGKRMLITRKGQPRMEEVVQLRYATWGEAERGHQAALKAVRKMRLKLIEAHKSGDQQRIERMRSKVQDLLRDV